MMKGPSDRQIAFAVWISRVTNKPLPAENTAQAYWLYIQDNLDLYHKIRNEKRKVRAYGCHKQKQRVYNSVMDDEQDAAWAASMDFDWM